MLITNKSDNFVLNMIFLTLFYFLVNNNTVDAKLATCNHDKGTKYEQQYNPSYFKEDYLNQLQHPMTACNICNEMFGTDYK